MKKRTSSRREFLKEVRGQKKAEGADRKGKKGKNTLLMGCHDNLRIYNPI